MPPTPVVLGPRAEFIEKNLGLVHSCAGRFKGRGIEYDDLFSAGCMGLVKAYDGFDGSRGLCFSTYAVPVKVSRSLKELSLKISAVRERCVKETGQEPTVSQLAERLDVTPEQVADAMSAAMPALSLTPVSDEDGSREFDIPEESCEETVSDLLSLKSVLGTLTKEERTLIYLRFFKNKTQSETARVLHTTQVQISRKERKILAAMREQLTD